MSDLQGLICADEKVRKYFDFMNVPELHNSTIISAFKDDRDGKIKYIRLNGVFIKCDHPKVSITSDKNKNGNFDVSISQKGDYWAHINIDLCIGQIPITLNIDEDVIHGIFLSINTYTPLFNIPSTDEIINL